ncbi:hypothetical protein QBC34DRAFT_35064 [Podospora aff. communis PSN243]|uniref:F-box domain-containing protein n=1 Tax=Podospora aff. communis PSN243 TaxID=3040156 RepID=A0AAV9GWV7_9PEZI|nr:hypothetical protein QBC34DRAFT_35064 [Podospora aff. communis PSN243]
MSPLVKLPYELLWLVVQYLDLEDTHALSLSCRSLRFLFHEPNIAKIILETKAPNTLEARQAQASRRYASELRRLTKRREAISSISPYLVALVAHADSWIYENGVLCHTKERQLRILDLHRSQSTEIVIDIRRLLDEALEESHGYTKYKFQPLYYSHGVVSCLYAHRKTTQSSWLVVFDVLKGRVLTTRSLTSTLKIFVRNNEKFLCYGVFAPTTRDGYRRWTAGCYDIGGNAWSKREVELPEFIGSDIGSTIAFEIFDDSLHGISNQTCLEAEEEDWLSYYTCFRVPLTNDGFGPIEHASRRHMWRRWHFEGPIDDRWTFLRIFRDETSSKLRVVESRKEWLARSSSARRTYYTTDIVFDDGGPTRMPSANDKFLDHVLLATRTKTSHPDRTPAPPRNPHMVHPGDDGSRALMFTLTKSPVRCYHPSCQTFIDLVDDPPEFDPGARRIRIRGSARRRWTSGEHEERSLSGAAETGESHNTLKMEGFHNTFDEIAKIYKSEDVSLWPPDQSLSDTNSALEALHEVMNPAGCFGSIRGAWDERSVVYSIEETGGLHALVLVSFDPSIYLKGAKGYYGSPKVGEVSGGILGSPVLEASPPRGGKGKDKDRASGSWHPTPEPDTACSMDGSTASSKPASSVGSAPWRRVVPAMYQRMPSGFHFAL